MYKIIYIIICTFSTYIKGYIYNLGVKHYYFLNITPSISLKRSLPPTGQWVWQIFLVGQNNFSFVLASLFIILSPEEC